MNNFRFFYLSLLCCFIAGAFQSKAQKEFRMPETREVIVIQGDSTVKAHVLYSLDKKVKPKAEKRYHWYAGNTIRQNNGDFDGKLLSGPYKVFDKNNNLILKGEIKYGLKHGKWTSWFPNGTIQHMSEWKKGELHGDFVTYDNTGKLIQKVEYKRGEKLGDGKEFDGKSDYTKVKYVNMKKVPEETNKIEGTKEKKGWNWFKKGEKKEKESTGKAKKEKTEKADKNRGSIDSGTRKKEKEKKEKTDKKRDKEQKTKEKEAKKPKKEKKAAK
jgi:hypothetical protein